MTAIVAVSDELLRSINVDISFAFAHQIALAAADGIDDLMPQRLFHEQSRSARDEHVNVLWDNIKANDHFQFKTFIEMGKAGANVGESDFDLDHALRGARVRQRTGPGHDHAQGRHADPVQLAAVGG